MKVAGTRTYRRFLRIVLASTLLACAAAVGAAPASAMQVVEPDGSVILAWGDVEVTRIGADGVPDGEVYDISPEPHFPSDRLNPEESHLMDLGVAPDGVVTAVWLNIEGQARIVTRQIAPDGTPLGEPVELASGEEIHTRARLGVGPDGTATVVWNRLSSPGNELVARRIAPDGTPEDEIQVLSAPGSTAWWPEMAMAPDGTATVVWSDRDEAGNALLLERRIAPDGTLVATNVVASNEGLDPKPYFDEPRIGGGADGSAIVLWETRGAVDELWSRRIAPDGSLDPPQLLDSFDASTKYRFPRLAVAPDGSASVIWKAKPDMKVLSLDSDGIPGEAHLITYKGDPLPAEPKWQGQEPLLQIAPDGTRYVFWGSGCEGEWCLYFGTLQSDGSIAEAQLVDQGKSLAWWQSAFFDDGSGTLIWGHLFSHEPNRIDLRARKLTADGTLGPIGEAFIGDLSPLLRTYGQELDFGQVEAGSHANRSVDVWVMTDEALGSFSPSIEGADGDEFAIESSTCGPQLSYPAVCSVSVSFSPNAVGPAEAELVLEAGEGFEPTSVPLSGEGVPALAPSPPQPPPPAPLVVGIGKPAVDLAAGSASLPVLVPGPGSVTIYGPCVGGPEQARSLQVSAAGSVDFEIVAKGRCRRQLLRTGTTRFGVRVLFTAADGQATVDHRPVRLWLTD
ncbi:MAG TPA: hypothetical protein VFU11_09750 [Solirubrobacterales bacterium]|nr:hypothetical protein [Solirubrobacterales bacterium]